MQIIFPKRKKKLMSQSEMMNSMSQLDAFLKFIYKGYEGKKKLPCYCMSKPKLSKESNAPK